VGSPRIDGELLKSGIEVEQSTVAKISSPPAEATFPDVANFLTNHMDQMASIDFFVVPTATPRQP
jgi:hypothetical protein